MLRRTVSSASLPQTLFLRRHLVNIVLPTDPATTHHYFCGKTTLPPVLPLPMPEDEVEAVEDLIGYRFRNRILLEEALIHPSYPYRRLPSFTSSASDGSFKNLGAIGKKALDSTLRSYVDLYMSSNYWRGPYDYCHSCRAYTLAARLISAPKLARTAIYLGLYRFLRRDSFELNHKVEEFTKVINSEEYFITDIQNSMDFDSKYDMEGNKEVDIPLVQPPEVLVDIVEAFAGAITEDGGNCDDWSVITKLLEPIIRKINYGDQWDEIPEVGINELEVDSYGYSEMEIDSYEDGDSELEFNSNEDGDSEWHQDR